MVLNKEMLSWHYLFSFALEYAIRKVQANLEKLKFGWTHKVLVYANDDNWVKAYKLKCKQLNFISS
jgi:hypothetical protein